MSLGGGGGGGKELTALHSIVMCYTRYCIIMAKVHNTECYSSCTWWHNSKVCLVESAVNYNGGVSLLEQLMQGPRTSHISQPSSLLFHHLLLHPHQ